MSSTKKSSVKTKVVRAPGRATIADVAREAGMVPGNLYRYFPSKDAMIAGLAERDRLEIAADFASLSGAPDFLEAFKALGRKYFLEEPREKAIIALEIWAESSRNPQMAAMRAAARALAVPTGPMAPTSG